MKRICVPIVGTGVEGDPYRPPLPTYSLGAVDHTANCMVVDVPDHHDQLLAEADAHWQARLEAMHNKPAGAYAGLKKLPIPQPPSVAATAMALPPGAPQVSS